jgi:hypothetical protein
MALALPWRAAAFDGRTAKYVEHHQASGRVRQSRPDVLWPTQCHTHLIYQTLHHSMRSQRVSVHFLKFPCMLTNSHVLAWRHHHICLPVPLTSHCHTTTSHITLHRKLRSPGPSLSAAWWMSSCPAAAATHNTVTQTRHMHPQRAFSDTHPPPPRHSHTHNLQEAEITWAKLERCLVDVFLPSL